MSCNILIDLLTSYVFSNTLDLDKTPAKTNDIPTSLSCTVLCLVLISKYYNANKVSKHLLNVIDA